ncbi:hypothetical protein ABH935_000170 [Catenulispora sp. GAS73]|uniref:hypothetical protein n=1 Tax=Catenulispora sp. GAS73 TaxID=3156269 RepID=UPI0035149091
MSDVLPRHVLCVLGSGLELSEIERIAGADRFTLDWEYSQTEPDPQMPQAFQACTMNAVSFDEKDQLAVESHDTVGYLLSPPMPREQALAISRGLLVAAGDLLRAGATAVKNESSGIAHGRTRWLALADRAAGAEDLDVLAGALVEAWVQRPIADDGVLYTCGMHLLGAPDVEIEASAQERAGGEVADLAGLLDVLAYYLLTDPRAKEVEDGAGFRMSEDSPRWVLRTGACERYESDDFFFNPYGYVRLTSPE